MTIEDLEKVLRVAKETDLYSLILLEVFTGMRKGEILGLQWENVDLEKKVLWVRKNLCRVENNDEEDGRKTKLILLEPKTKKSIREIPLSEEAVKVLKIHKRKQNEQKCFIGTFIKTMVLYLQRQMEVLKIHEKS